MVRERQEARETAAGDVSAATRAGQLLRSTSLGSGLTDEDLTFMFTLLLRHPDAERKIGYGVARITVEQNPRFPSARMFVVYRMDGTRDDFSYRKCLSGEIGVQQQLLTALRLEVHDQIEQFRRRALGEGARFCPHTREPLPGNDPHVHHAFAPFVSIALRFVFLEGGCDHFRLAPDPGGGSRLSDRDQAQRWYAYHAWAARLRLVSKRANTGLLRRQPELDRQIAFCTYCGDAEHDEGTCAA